MLAMQRVEAAHMRRIWHDLGQQAIPEGLLGMPPLGTLKHEQMSEGCYIFCCPQHTASV